ncbi:MAG: nucleotidyl transferase AbiEii/AbiGii toxin family protein [Tannerella sp.]|jgi:predicted nucleotidyltransferase component of viral defense system|nr:nucleotidyl transferase AbiEii/AbiGii toxin family protein [Tannerella sp.]
MDKWQNIADNRRIFIIENIADKTKLSPDAVEKDWWVTMTLKALFSCECADHIVFKGGTSLSKAWNLIERFSEDVDIAIDRKFFGFDGELKKKQINNLRRASCTYISGKLKEELDNKLKDNGIDGYSLSVPETQDTTKDPQTIEILYNSLFASSYIRDKVVIEIGARSLIEPSENIQIRSIIADNFPDTDFADTYFVVPTVIPQRTFLEKAFLLHEEFQKPFEKVRIDRMTRHIYDLEKLMDTDFATEALNNRDLYNAIIEHRRTLTAMKEVDYSTHSPQTINFVPPDFVMNEWREDYEKMKNMIYGESLPFDKLIERIKELNERFRKIKI